MKNPTKTAIKKALKESIEHWKTMIEWVSKQRVNDCVDIRGMYHVIRMDWLDRSCALCITCRDIGDTKCYACPLGYDSSCCREWQNVNSTDNWGQWHHNAKIMLGRLENELEKTKLKPQKKQKTKKNI